jgi:hypothetical protein
MNVFKKTVLFSMLLSSGPSPHCLQRRRESNSHWKQSKLGEESHVACTSHLINADHIFLNVNHCVFDEMLVNTHIDSSNTLQRRLFDIFTLTDAIRNRIVPVSS